MWRGGAGTARFGVRSPPGLFGCRVPRRLSVRGGLLGSSTLASLAILAALSTGMYATAAFLAFVLLVADQALRRTAWGAPPSGKANSSAALMRIPAISQARAKLDPRQPCGSFSQTNGTS